MCTLSLGKLNLKVQFTVVYPSHCLHSSVQFNRKFSLGTSVSGPFKVRTPKVKYKASTNCDKLPRTRGHAQENRLAQLSRTFPRAPARGSLSGPVSDELACTARVTNTGAGKAGGTRRPVTWRGKSLERGERDQQNQGCGPHFEDPG